jgi:hypothetical protein
LRLLAHYIDHLQHVPQDTGIVVTGMAKHIEKVALSSSSKVTGSRTRQSRPSRLW